MGGGGGQTGAQVKVLSGIQINTSILGGAIPIVYGTTRLSDNLVWYNNFMAFPQTGGGKGGGGGQTTGFYYWASILNAICEGPISHIGTVWSGKTITNATAAGLTVFTGTYPQDVWGYLSAMHPDQALNYAGIAYVCAASYFLDTSGSMPNLNYEVFGKFLNYNGYDANPVDIIIDLLTNPKTGAGISLSFLGDLTQYSNYCIANGLLLSVALNQQTKLTDILDKLMKATNSELVFSEGVIKIIPYGDTQITANGATFTPNITPIYDISDDDYLNRESPVQITRSSPADAYNQFQIEYLDRSNHYNPAIAMHDDLANIDMYGLKPNQPIQMHEICNSDTANKIVQLICNRTLYVRNTYQFDVSWKYVLLEPMDIVTITDATLGLNKFPVRISDIAEGPDGKLTITADEYPFGTLNATLYPNQTASGYMPPYTTSAGNTNQPMIFEAPDSLSNGLEIWMGASGSSLWGGCDVYLSYDNVSYTQIGSITTPTKQGLIVSDGGIFINVDMSISNSTLQSGSLSDFNNLANLMVSEDELLNFQNANLTGTSLYTLTPTNRGLYGTTSLSHTSGSLISKVDQNAVLKIPFTTSQIGQTVYIKTPSFNILGAAHQSLADVLPYQYKILGHAYQSPLPIVTNFIDYYKGTTIYLKWDTVNDFRMPIDYEIRYGSTWNNGQVVGRVSSLEFIPQNAGTYWIKAHYLFVPSNKDIYSVSEVGITITDAAISKNYIATYDEKANGWVGPLIGGASILNSNLILSGTGLISSIPLISSANTIAYYGGVDSYGEYDSPLSHNIDIGIAQSCNISLSYLATGYSVTDLVSMWPLVSTIDSVTGNIASKWSVVPQINIAGNDGIFTGWKNFYPTDYIGRIFKIRLILESFDTSISVQVSSLVWSVDVPDRVDTGSNATISASGTSVLYTRPFLGVPNTQITILNAQAGDDAILSFQNLSGFTIQIINSGVGVSRSINWLSQSY